MKTLRLGTALWLTVGGLLAWQLLLINADARVLTASEMRDIAKGATPDCNGSYSIAPCWDDGACTSKLNMAACLAAGACHRCSNAGASDYTCVNARPWTVRNCTADVDPTGCGKLYDDNQACNWAGACHCQGGMQLADDCPQFLVTYTVPCIRQN